MGLDNGINIKRTDRIAKYFNEKLYPHFYYVNDCDIEIAYWRKCWNIRNAILDILDVTEDNDSHTEISIPQMKEIIKFLKSLNENNWEENGYSIWTWEESKKHIKFQIKKLKRLIKLMKRYDIEVYFYDSW
jgi:hypothetical protein